jgi:hypothetical protein
MVKVNAAKMKAHKMDENSLNQREASILESISTIAKVYSQDQCEGTEACIRLKHLIELLPEYRDDFDNAIIFKMYDEVKDFDTFESYNKLSLAERVSQDRERQKIQANYELDLKRACEMLYFKITSNAK